MLIVFSRRWRHFVGKMVVALVRRLILKRLKGGSFCETRARILLVVLRKQQYSRSGDHVIRLKDSVHGWLVEGSERCREVSRLLTEDEMAGNSAKSA